MRFTCAFLAFFLANFSIPLVMDQAALGIPAITVLTPSPACGRCCRHRRRRFRRFGGMMIDLGSLLVSLFYAFLKCNVTMVWPSPNLTKSPPVPIVLAT